MRLPVHQCRPRLFSPIPRGAFRFSTSAPSPQHVSSSGIGGRPKVKIMEVSPRDGLQNESALLTPNLISKLISKLAGTGLTSIEAGSFVSPKWVPQMAGTADVLRSKEVLNLFNTPGIELPVLVPNKKGLEAFSSLLDALPPRPPNVSPPQIALFGASSPTFLLKNTNISSVTDSLSLMSKVAFAAKEKGWKIRGYVSCVVGCPYEGRVDPEGVEVVARELIEMGADEVSLGDTIGVGTPQSVAKLIETVSRSVPPEKLAAHCHDTFGTSIANVLTMVRMGVRTVDSSIAGLGGCPYSPGATGNVATEDVVYALESEGFDTGLLSPPSSSPSSSSIQDHHSLLSPDLAYLSRLEHLASVGQWITDELSKTPLVGGGKPKKRENQSRVGKAVLAKRDRRVRLEEEAIKAKL